MNNEQCKRRLEEVMKRLERSGPGRRPACVAERRWIVMEVLGNKCAHCGNDDWRVLDFDHIQPTSEGQKRERTSAAIRRILKGDCSNIQLLCSNCHHIKTSAERRARKEIR